MIWQDRYGPVSLTEKGSKYAANVFKRHQVIRCFLEEILQVDTKTAEKEACILEHVLSDQTYHKISNMLQKNGVYREKAGD